MTATTVETFCTCGSLARRYGSCLRCGLPEGPKVPEAPPPTPPEAKRAWAITVVTFALLVLGGVAVYLAA